ncbi:MAG: 3'-5' exonuclease, partial [Bacillota bacterium]|nr:3'-5' exonuclease [Bacillota bacterium]
MEGVGEERSPGATARPVVEALRRRGIPVAVTGHTSILAKPETALVARVFVWWAGGAGETATWYPNHDYVPEVISTDGLLQEIVALTGTGEAKGREILQELRALGEEVRTGWVEDIVALYDRILAVLGLPGRGQGVRYRELGLGCLSGLLTRFERALRRAAPPSFYQNLTGAEAEEAGEDGTLREVTEEGDAAQAEAARATCLTLGTTPGEIFLVRLRAFLEHFAGRAGEEVPDEDPEAQDAVRVMTVHQAKGLEFPVVFVPSLVKGRFPSSLTGRPQLWYVPGDLFDRPRYEGREEDEARLLYVALTRAQELLVVSWFERYESKTPGEPSSRATPSPFLTQHLQAALSGARPLCSVQVPLIGLRHEKKPLLTDFSSLSLYAQCGYRYWLSRVCGFQPLLA